VLSETGKPGRAPLATVTHARLRAAQGDVAAARRILQTSLAERPGDKEAEALLATLPPAAHAAYSEPQDESLAPPEPARGEELSARFREALAGPPIETAVSLRTRLELLLGRIDEVRRGGRAR
jgi:hypothetical protein